MMIIAIAAAVACPVGMHIVGAYEKDLPLYQGHVVASHIVPNKGVIDPPLVVIGCTDRDFFIRQSGQVLMVTRTDVVLDQGAIKLPICDDGPQGQVETAMNARGMRAGDQTCIEAHAGSKGK